MGRALSLTPTLLCKSWLFLAALLVGIFQCHAPVGTELREVKDQPQAPSQRPAGQGAGFNLPRSRNTSGFQERAVSPGCRGFLAGSGLPHPGGRLGMGSRVQALVGMVPWVARGFVRSLPAGVKPRGPQTEGPGVLPWTELRQTPALRHFSVWRPCSPHLTELKLSRVQLWAEKYLNPGLWQ